VALKAGLRAMAADQFQAQGDRADLGPDRQPQEQYDSQQQREPAVAMLLSDAGLRDHR
jgi:hypothetical protein